MFNNLKRNRNYKGRDINYVLFCKTQEGWILWFGVDSAGTPTLNLCFHFPIFCMWCWVKPWSECYTDTQIHIIQKSVLFFPVFSSSSFLFAVLSFSTVPDHAHFLCRDFDSAIRLAAEPPLADLIETIWIAGGVQLYKVNQYGNIHLDCSVFKV